jgi:sec-independent protein translocase protein TatB
MEIFGIGAPELLFIVVIALIVLGPRDMQKAGRTIGRWLNELVHSDGWRVFQKTSREVRTLPNTLMREANMELMQANAELRKSLDMPPSQSSSAPTPGGPSGKTIVPSLQSDDYAKSTEADSLNAIPEESEKTIHPPPKKLKDVR